VLRRACQDAVTWPKGTKVAVNMSPVQFRDRSLGARVVSALAKSGLPAQNLDLEITERVLLEESDNTLYTMEQLKVLGVRISLDDFGTGYSSLSYLATLPAAELKIDKSFVLGMDSDSDYRTIIKSVIGMAHDLKLRVVAEGIETQEIEAALQHMGCDIGQGYLYGKPMAISDFEACLNAAEWGARRRDPDAVDTVA
jgi:EAL domain-containing protein (putative c-di-GMP-specific phosphodiesterase class I)